MTGSGQRLTAGILAVAAVVILAVAGFVVATHGPGGPEGAGGSPPRAAPGAPTTPPASAPDLPLDPAAAEALGGEGLLAAGFAAAAGPWSELGNPEWEVRERPVYVARARLPEGRSRVEADVTIGFRAAEATDRLVLRFLPAADVLRRAGAGLDVSVTREGEEVAHEVDHPGARLLVPLDPPLTAGGATTVRVRFSYDVPDSADIPDRGGPAEFGLLARNPEATVLGHWLPLLTISTDDGPMVGWGDVGAFPAAVWSVLLETPAAVVTGGEEDDCPEQAGPGGGCVWARGIALRDVAVVAFDRLAEEPGQVGRLRVNSVGPASMSEVLPAALKVARGSVVSFASRFGPLAWNEVDVVAAPLSGAAAGMEFPGLVIVDDGLYGSVENGEGMLVVAHEVAHQWFHALVGNGSLSAPVVDESLAQYLSYLYVADEFGEPAAKRVADAVFRSQYAFARAAGLDDEPPAQPLAAFDSATAYSTLVYARAAMGWVAAEEAAGRDAVVAVLADAVQRWALGFVNDDEFLTFVDERAPEIGAVLRRYWNDPDPIPT